MLPPSIPSVAQESPMPPVRLDVNGLFTCDYYREVMVENREDVNKFITVEFDNSMAAEVSNSNLPSRVGEVIRSNDSEPLIVLNKLHYLKPWGPMNFRVIVEDGDKWKKSNAIPSSFKVYGTNEVEEKPQEPSPPEPSPVQSPPIVPVRRVHSTTWKNNSKQKYPVQGRKRMQYPGAAMGEGALYLFLM